MVIVYQKETRKIKCQTSYFAIPRNMESRKWTFHEKKYCHKSPFGHISTIAIGENRVVIISKLIDAFRP